MSGCSAAWLARFVRDEEVVGSNPATPTILSQLENPIREYEKRLGRKSAYRVHLLKMGGVALKRRDPDGSVPE